MRKTEAKAFHYYLFRYYNKNVELPTLRITNNFTKFAKLL